MALPGEYTKAEINSQPATWEKSLLRLGELDTARLPRPEDFDQVIFTGCGSTYYLSIWAARSCQRLTGITSRPVPAGELLMTPEVWLHKSKRTLLVAISRSASTTETIMALQAFQAGGYGDDIVITNYSERKLAELSRNVIALPDAQEQSVAQTRSFTSMMLGVSYLIERQIPPGLPGRLRTTGEHLLDQYDQLSKTLGANLNLKRFIFLGSEALFGLASEAMLKMKEMALASSEAFHFLEFRHGPISIVDGRTLVIGMLDGQKSNLKMNVLHDVKALGASALYIGEDDPGEMALDHPVTFGNDLATPWRDVLFLPVLQSLAFQRALANHQDPDHPTNLTAVVVKI